MDPQNNPNQRPRQPRQSIDGFQRGRISYDRFSSDGMVRPPRPSQPQAVQPATPQPTPQAQQPQFTPTPQQTTQAQQPAERLFSPAPPPTNKRQPKGTLFARLPRKKLIFSGAGALAIAIVAVSVFTQGVALGELKTVKYKNSKAAYSIAFYKKSSSKIINSDNTQFISKVSKEDKLPLTLSIENGDTGAYGRLRDCTGFTKVTDVTNKNLTQDITICDASKEGRSGVYVAGFVHKGQLHIITIGQDTGSNDNPEALAANIGLSPYQEDIKKIVSSVNIK